MMSDPKLAAEEPVADWRKREKRRLLTFVLIPVILVTAWFVGSAIVSHFVHKSRKEKAERLLNWMRQRGEHEMEFYDTSGTYEILGHLRGNLDIHSLTFTLTDVSEEGLGVVANLPNLRRLELYGGGGVTDTALKQLRGKIGLEELVLKNTLVTNDGLAILKELPELKKLTIFQEGWRRKDLSDAGLAHLATLSELKVLKVSGGWASEGAIRALRAKMPKCRIDVVAAF